MIIHIHTSAQSLPTLRDHVTNLVCGNKKDIPSPQSRLQYRIKGLG